MDQDALARGMREALRGELVDAPRKCAVLLSGGMDSLALAATLVGLGRRPLAVCFHLRNRESADLIGARRAADVLGLELVEVPLTTDFDELELELQELARDGVRGKAAMECSWAVRAGVRAAVARGAYYVVSGAGSDWHFVLSKKGMIHHRGSVAEMDEFRAACFSISDGAQIPSTAAWAASISALYVPPFHSAAFRSVTQGTSWEELNRPRQKEPLRRAFSDVEAQVRPRGHSNLQLGDSGIAELCWALSRSRDASSPVALYNAYAREAGSFRGSSKGRVYPRIDCPTCGQRVAAAYLSRHQCLVTPLPLW